MEKQEIKVGTKVMWQIHDKFVPYTKYEVATIVSETKTTFRIDNKYNIKKDSLLVVGEGDEWCRVTAEIFDDKKYYENYILPKQVYVTKMFICKNIHEYVEICSGGELATLHEKMFTTLERNKKNDKKDNK